MSLRTLAAVALAAAAVLPVVDAQAHQQARQHIPRGAVKGDLLVIFRGAGSGGYRYHEPAAGAGSACQRADTTYSENDSYDWDYRFVVPPSGGSSVAPSVLLGGGELNGSEQLAQCANAAALVSTCTQGLNPPLATATADLAYPSVVVGTTGRTITVGAIGELVLASSQADCTGPGIFTPNPVQGFSQLQASISFPRAALNASGDVVRHFTMAGSGLYDGVALSGSCDSAGCNTRNCTDSGGAASGPPTSCSFSEGYSGTIEVRVIQ